MKLSKKNGEIYFETDEISLKITSDRYIYYKKENDTHFKNTEHKIPIGLTQTQKENYLIGLRNEYLKRNEGKEEWHSTDLKEKVQES